MTYTTVEQSDLLVEHGLKPTLADLTYVVDKIGVDFKTAGLAPSKAGDMTHTESTYIPKVEPYTHTLDMSKPCWSAERLIELLPRKISYDGVDDIRLVMHLKSHPSGPVDYIGYYKYSNQTADWTHRVCGGMFGKEGIMKTLLQIYTWLLDNRKLVKYRG